MNLCKHTSCHSKRVTLRSRSSTQVRQSDWLGPSFIAGGVSLGSPRAAAGDSGGERNHRERFGWSKARPTLRRGAHVQQPLPSQCDYTPPTALKAWPRPSSEEGCTCTATIAILHGTARDMYTEASNWKACMHLLRNGAISASQAPTKTARLCLCWCQATASRMQQCMHSRAATGPLRGTIHAVA
jgi:hypothetical protein